MLHTESLTHSHLLSSSRLCPLCLYYFASPSLFCPFTTSQGAKRGNREGERRKKQNKTENLAVSLCLAADRLCPPSSRLPPPSSQWDVLTLCNRCACPIQSAKPMDPLNTSFKRGTRQHMCNLHTHVHIHRKPHCIIKMLTEVIPFISSP